MGSLWQLILSVTALALTLLAWRAPWRDTAGRSGPPGSLSASLALCRTGLAQALQNSPESQAAAAEAALRACVRAAIAGVSNDSLAASLQRVTRAPHIAGTPENMAAAAFVESSFKESGLKVHTVDFPALLAYPGPQSLSILSPHPLNLSLRESVFPEDPYSADPRVSTPFLSYSPSGSVAGPVVYANFGTLEDFALLAAFNVSCKGRVVLMRYGAIYRGDKVANAAKSGAAGAIIYSDPQQDAPGGSSADETYPFRNALPPSGAQRGSIFCGVPGDPRTPGWPSCSQPGACEAWTTQDLTDRGLLPTIPALPTSYSNAARILRHLGGAPAPPSWQGAVPGVPGGYHLGPGPVEVSLEVESNFTVTAVRDVIAVLEGSEEPERFVVLGNHRDAWVYGAADPNSGTACLLEVGKVLGSLYAGGWRPRRSVVLASWDAEEFNLVGSTEWVERNLPLLASQAVAYLNVDTAVAGPGFHAAATPQLDGVIRYAAGMVQDPDGPPGQTVLDTWQRQANSSEPPLERLGGGGSDFAAFLQHAGVASADLFWGGGYPMYHSAYDNFHWTAAFGDPLFRRHVACTQVLLAALLNLTASQVLPLDYRAYAREIQAYVDDLNSTLSAALRPEAHEALTLEPLFGAAHVLRDAAETFHGERAVGEGGSERGGERGDGRGGVGGESRVRSVNDRMMLAERAFLDPMGLGPNATWYKHLVYGPTAGNGYGTDVFPALRDAMSPLLKPGAKPDSPSVVRLRTDEGDDNASAGLGRVARRELKASPRQLRKRSAPNLGGSHGAGGWESVQHEIFRVAQAVVRVAHVLSGTLH